MIEAIKPFEYQKKMVVQILHPVTVDGKPHARGEFVTIGLEQALALVAAEYATCGFGVDEVLALMKGEEEAHQQEQQRQQVTKAITEVEKSFPKKEAGTPHASQTLIVETVKIAINIVGATLAAAVRTLFGG